MEAKRQFDGANKKQQPKLDRYGRLRKAKEPDFAQWVVDSVQRLVEHRHSLSDIAEYSLDKVVSLLHAIDRVDARNRLMYITDMSSMLGGMFGGGDGLTRHIEELNEVTTGE